MALRCLLVVIAVGCGAPSGTTAPTSSSPTPLAAKTGAGATAVTHSPVQAAARPDEAAIFARLQPDLVACYEKGRKAVPTMVDGRVTLNGSVDEAGKGVCTIPTDAKGLTQEVVDCMSARLGSERFGSGPAATFAVHVALRAGNVELGTQPREDSTLSSVETRRMPDAFDVLETLVPELQECVRTIDRASSVRTVMVGARIATSGKTECALASGSPAPLPKAAADCTEKVFRNATFPPPTGGPGLILVPISIFRN